MGDAEWVSWEAAVEWVAEAYQLSAGAAQAEFDAAIRSGRVQECARLGTLAEPIPVSSLQGLGSLLLHDHRVNFADLQWQIGRQLDRPTHHLGRPPAAFWSDAHKLIDDWLDENGFPQPGDGNQAKLETAVQDYLSAHFDEHPSESTIRAHVKERIAEYKLKLGAK